MAQKISRRDLMKAGVAAAIPPALISLASGGENQPLKYSTWDSIIDESDYSIRVSRQVLDIFEREYDQHEEDMYVLLANAQTGVIEKATSMFCYKYGAENCGAERGLFRWLDEVSRQHGYFVVGYYHSHPGPKTASRAGDVLSGDDIPRHDDVENDVFRLLGNGFAGQGIPFETRAFVPLHPRVIGKDHPYRERMEEFSQRKLTARSRYDDFEDKHTLQPRIKTVESEVNPGVENIIMGHPPFMRVFERPISYRDFIEFRKSALLVQEADDFPYKDKSIKCKLQAKLRHDGAMTIEVKAEAPGWKPHSWHNYRGFTLDFDKEGEQDAINYSPVNMLHVRGHLGVLLETAPKTIQERFKQITSYSDEADYRLKINVPSMIFPRKRR